MNDLIETIRLEPREGFDLLFKVHYDPYTTPSEFDCYTPKQIEAWTNDRWQYAWLEVVASVAGVDLGQSALGGVEFGNFLITDEEDNEVRTVWVWAEDLARDYAEDLSAEAIASARIVAEHISNELAKVS